MKKFLHYMNKSRILFWWTLSYFIGCRHNGELQCKKHHFWYATLILLELVCDGGKQKCEKQIMQNENLWESLGNFAVQHFAVKYFDIFSNRLCCLLVSRLSVPEMNTNECGRDRYFLLDFLFGCRQNAQARI